MLYRKIWFYKQYFNDFFRKQSTKVKQKIIWTLELIEDLEHVPEKYLKHLTDTDGLYEIRVRHSNDIFRIFCFFDKGDLVVIMNAFIPKKEIDKALTIRKEYEAEQK